MFTVHHQIFKCGKITSLYDSKWPVFFLPPGVWKIMHFNSDMIPCLFFTEPQLCPSIIHDNKFDGFTVEAQNVMQNVTLLFWHHYKTTKCNFSQTVHYHEQSLDLCLHRGFIWHQVRHSHHGMHWMHNCGEFLEGNNNIVFSALVETDTYMNKTMSCQLELIFIRSGEHKEAWSRSSTLHCIHYAKWCWQYCFPVLFITWKQKKKSTNYNEEKYWQ